MKIWVFGIIAVLFYAGVFVTAVTEDPLRYLVSVRQEEMFATADLVCSFCRLWLLIDILIVYSHSDYEERWSVVQMLVPQEWRKTPRARSHLGLFYFERDRIG